MNKRNIRWAKAQNYEKKHWRKVADRIAEGTRGQLGWYKWKAEQFEKKIGNVHEDFISENSRIVEIGSGPIGIVSGLSSGERYAVEPLGDYFENNPILTEMRNSEVRYITGRGEKLPFDNNSANLVIIDNVLDHTEKPGKVISEAKRILHDDGYLYIGVNTRSRWGTFLHKTINIFNLDMGHPYEYTFAGIRKFMEGCGFKNKWEILEEPKLVRRKNLREEGVKGLIKVVSGLVEFYCESLYIKAK